MPFSGGARFEKAILEEAHLAGAFLIGADLRYALLARTNFDRAWLFGANFKGARVNRVCITRGYHATEPILDWLKEALGHSPWRWVALREGLDTPSDDAVSGLQDRLARLTGRTAGEEHVREGLRQIGFFLENELTISDAGEVDDVQIAGVLKIRGLVSDT